VRLDEHPLSALADRGLAFQLVPHAFSGRDGLAMRHADAHGSTIAGWMADEPKTFMLLHRDRLDALWAQSRPWLEEHMPKVALTGVQVLGSGLSWQVERIDQRIQLHKEIGAIRTYLRKKGRLHGFADPDNARNHYFHGSATMYAIPFRDANPATLYFTFETEQTYVAAGAKLQYRVGLLESDAKAKENATDAFQERVVAQAVLRSTFDDNDDLKDLPSIEAGRSWEWVIAETFHQISASHRGFLPDRFELLAWTEAYTKADDIRGFMPKRKNVLVGVPLYVAYAS
jgi:hypothetical protein